MEEISEVSESQPSSATGCLSGWIEDEVVEANGTVVRGAG